MNQGYVVDAKLYTFAMGLEWNIAQSLAINSGDRFPQSVDSITNHSKSAGEGLLGASKTNTSDRKSVFHQTPCPYSPRDRHVQDSNAHSSRSEDVRNSCTSFFSQRNVQTLAFGTVLGIVISGIAIGVRTSFAQKRKE